MIYGAVAAAMVLVLVMRRGSSSASTGGATDPNSAALTPVSNPAVDTGSYGAGVGPDYSSQLADFESQLSTVVGQAVQNGMAAQPAPGATAPAPGSLLLTVDPNDPRFIALSNATGQQVGGGSASPSSAAPRGAARPHPSHSKATPKPKTKPKRQADPHPGWGPHTRAAGHKLKGHSTRY